jgi:CelD/BcsL family acetyltransferase involved in cellulose biosynthesis
MPSTCDAASRSAPTRAAAQPSVPTYTGHRAGFRRNTRRRLRLLESSRLPDAAAPHWLALAERDLGSGLDRPDLIQSERDCTPKGKSV